MSAEEWTLSRLKDNPVDALECIHALEAEVAAARESQAHAEAKQQIAENEWASAKARAEAAEAKLVTLNAHHEELHEGQVWKQNANLRASLAEAVRLLRSAINAWDTAQGPMNRRAIEAFLADNDPAKTPSGVPLSPPEDDFFGQKVRKCVLCGHRGLCEYSRSDRGPVCFDGIACVGRQSRKPTRRPSAETEDC